MTLGPKFIFSRPHLATLGRVDHVERAPQADIKMFKNCQWLDDPKGAKCGEPVKRGSYCAKHYSIAYVK